MAFVTPGPYYPQRRIDFAAVTDSFQTLIDHWKIYILAGLAILGTSLPFVVADFLDELPDLGFEPLELGIFALEVIQIILLIPTMLITPLIGIGVTKFTLNVTRGNPPDSSDIWEGIRHPLTYLGLTLLAGLVSFMGVFLCIFGIHITSGLMLFAYPIKIDTQASASACVSRSWEMLKPEWFMAAVFSLLIGIIAGLGSAVVAVGMMFTWPFLYIAETHLYNRYTGHYNAPPPNAPQQHSPYPRPGQPYQPGPAQQYPPPNQPQPGVVPQNQPGSSKPKPHPGANPNNPSPGSDPLRPDRP